MERWEHFRAGSFELPSDGVGISCPASEPARPSLLLARIGASPLWSWPSLIETREDRPTMGQLSELTGSIQKTDAAGVDLSITAVHRDSPSCRHEI